METKVYTFEVDSDCHLSVEATGSSSRKTIDAFRAEGWKPVSFGLMSDEGQSVRYKVVLEHGYETAVGRG